MGINHLLNKSATVTRPTQATDGQGGDTETQSAHPTDPSIRVRYFAASGRDRVIAGRADEDVSHVAYVLPSVNIVRDDRLTVDSKEFDVIAALPPSRSHHVKLLLKEIRP